MTWTGTQDLTAAGFAISGRRATLTEAIDGPRTVGWGLVAAGLGGTYAPIAFRHDLDVDDASVERLTTSGTGSTAAPAAGGDSSCGTWRLEAGRGLLDVPLGSPVGLEVGAGRIRFLKPGVGIVASAPMVGTKVAWEDRSVVAISGDGIDIRLTALDADPAVLRERLAIG